MELIVVEVCGIRDFLGDKGVANLIFEGLFETGTPGPARLGRNKRIRLNRFRKISGRKSCYRFKGNIIKKNDIARYCKVVRD